MSYTSRRPVLYMCVPVCLSDVTLHKDGALLMRQHHPHDLLFARLLGPPRCCASSVIVIAIVCLPCPCTGTLPWRQLAHWLWMRSMGLRQRQSYEAG